MARFALAEGPRVGGRETVRAGRRTLCVGQECRKKSQRNRHAPQASGLLAQKTPRHAAQPALFGPVADAFGSSESPTGPRIPFRAPASAWGRPAGHTGDV